MTWSPDGKLLAFSAFGGEAPVRVINVYDRSVKTLTQPFAYLPTWSPNGKHIAGFFLPDWIAKRNFLRVLMDMKRVGHLVANGLQTTIQKRLPLQEVQKAITLYQANSTAGKVLLVADPEKIDIDE